MSADAIRLIVDSLNEEPFHLGINLITFDNFSNECLLQTLSDVISWINATDNIDVKNEPADQTALRILHQLKILKFKPPTDIEQLEEWRAGIVEGTKASVYPVLNYLFSNVDMLKQRAYLAKFLVKVDVPNELQDGDLTQMQAEVTSLMEQFKARPSSCTEVHSRATEMSGESEHVEGIKGDLKQMEAEREQVTRRIERIDTKIKNIPNIDKILEFAEMRRNETERYQTMEGQKAEIRPWMIKAEKKIKRLEGVLLELQHAAENIDPSELIEQLEGEIQTNSYLADEKLLREIDAKRPVIAELSRVVDGPAIDESTIQKLTDEIGSKNDSIRAMVEERERKEEGHDENFSIYRHQTASIERKKAAIAQQLQDARQELEHIEAQISTRKKELRQESGGEEIVTTVQFRNFANKLRIKSNDYKKKTAALTALESENNVLATTSLMLSVQWNQLKERIEDMGGDVTDINIEVPRKNERPKTAAPRTDNVEELRRMVKEMSARLSDKSDELAPLRRHHQGRTDQFNELLDTLRESKKENDRKKTALESGFAAVKHEVEELEQRKKRTDEKIEAANIKARLSQAQDQKRRLEMEGEGGRSIITEMQEAIHQAEQEYEELEKKNVSEMNIEMAKRQRLMWKSLLELFDAKIRVFQNDTDSTAPIGDRMSRM